MAQEDPKPTEYRARPLPENQTVAEKVKELQPEQRVVVEVKNWKQSVTIIVNGALLVAATVLQLLDLVFGANLLAPIVGVFTDDPEQATRIITFVTQAYTLLNLYLRAKTTAPITLRNDPKK
jgi:hypothetical protein